MTQRRRRVGPQMFLRPMAENTPLPPLQPYVRCSCGSCRACRENEKWDRVFAKFEDKDYYRHERESWWSSPLNDL